MALSVQTLFALMVVPAVGGALSSGPQCNAGCIPEHTKLKDGRVHCCTGGHESLACPKPAHYRCGPTLPGSQLWVFEADTALVRDPLLSADSSTVYVDSGDSLYALNGSTGITLWSVDFIKTNPTDIVECRLGLTTSRPTLSPLYYAMNVNDEMYIIDLLTGSTISSFLTNHVIASVPVLSTDSKVLYATGIDDNILAFDTFSGDILWTFTVGSWIPAAPLLGGGVVYVGSADSTIYAVDAHTGIKLWAFAAAGPPLSTPVLSHNGGVLYTVTGGSCASDSNAKSTVYAVDAHTGSQIWSVYFNCSCELGAPVVNKDNTIVYAGGGDGVLYAVNASTGSTIWIFGADSAIIATPALGPSDRVLYITSSNAVLYAVNALTGAPRWSVQTVFNPKAVTSGTDNAAVYVIGGNSLQAIKA